MAHLYTNCHNFRSNFDLKLTNFPKILASCQKFWPETNKFSQNFGFLRPFFFWWKLHHLLKIAPNLAHIDENCEKWPHSSYTKICKKKGSLTGVIDIPVRLILLPMIAACPYTHFCPKYPLGPGYKLYQNVWYSAIFPACWKDCYATTHSFMSKGTHFILILWTLLFLTTWVIG